MFHTKYGKDWPSRSREDVNGQWMTHDNRCQLITIGHLTGSGDLKKTNNVIYANVYDIYSWTVHVLQETVVIVLTYPYKCQFPSHNTICWHSFFLNLFPICKNEHSSIK